MYEEVTLYVLILFDDFVLKTCYRLLTLQQVNTSDMLLLRLGEKIIFGCMCQVKRNYASGEVL